MNIDYNKLVQLLLPTFLRKTFLIELFRPLVVQLQNLQSQFNLWLNDARYKANANASVISLTELIQREFDVLATIEELDGKPTDFKVTVSGTVDEQRLRSLINQYKVGGRSFIFRVGNVAYSCGFINHVCEDIIELYSVEFTDHVCEDDGSVEISCLVRPTEVVVRASKEVMSEITIIATVSGKDEDGLVFFGADFGATVLPGDKTVTVPITMNMVPGAYYFIDKSSVHIEPDSDSYYKYTYKP